MGFFSWKTADSQDTIWNRYVRDVGGPSAQPVYLLQPNGEAPILEPSYDGYGRFGDVDAYEWLARRNVAADKLDGLDDDSVRGIGITLECGCYYLDVLTGERWADAGKYMTLIVPDIREFAKDCSQVEPAFGMSPLMAIETGRLVRRPVSDIAPTALPLKFSFRADAVYEDLPGSEICDTQGFAFITDDDPEDDEDEDLRVYDEDDEDDLDIAA